MDPTGHNFQDDNLRQALRRAFPAEQAPPALRKRVAALLQDPVMCDVDTDRPEPVALTQPAGPIVSSDPIPLPTVAWFGNLFHGARRVALAASFAGLAMGIALFVTLQNSNSVLQPSGPQYVDAVPVSPFVQAAVVRHDEILKPADPTRASAASLRPLPQLRSELQEQQLPVPDADFSPHGWQLVGGQSWRNGNATVAQICYRRGNETLSVFIAPRDAQGRRTPMSTANLQDHIVATRETPAANLCVVGHSPDNKLTPAEVDRLADLLATTR